MVNWPFTFGGFLYFAFLHGRRLAEGVTSSRAIGGHSFAGGMTEVQGRLSLWLLTWPIIFVIFKRKKNTYT